MFSLASWPTHCQPEGCARDALWARVGDMFVMLCNGTRTTHERARSPRVFPVLPRHEAPSPWALIVR